MNRLQVALSTVLGFALPTLAQPVAPLTHDEHTKKHNPPHAKVLDTGRFHTDRIAAPLYLPAEEDAFTFIVFGDRTGGPNEGINVLAHAVADTNLIEPDLVMTVGDLIDGYNTTPDWLQQMAQYKEVMNELLCPWFPVAGNHDVYWRGPDSPKLQHESNYEMHFGPLWYSFDHKGSTFIALYTDEGDAETGEKNFRKSELQRISDEQLAWLDSQLERAAESDHVFVFVHHPRWIGGKYGDDWEKVHRRLVRAGNVSAVFGGHIHRMRSDPRDGIEYITLATVGGGQSGLAPKAGFLHHFNVVTVREGQIALASVPIGEVMDVREITGEVSEAANALSRVTPEFGSPVDVASDGSVNTRSTITLTNPTDFDIELAIAPESRDLRWIVQPDHTHATLAAGETRTFSFDVLRPGDSLDPYTRPLHLEIAADLLTDSARFPMNTATFMMPGTLVLERPESPRINRVLQGGNNGSGAAVDFNSVPVHQGPITVEAWVRPTRFDRRDGIVGSDGYGLWLDNGRPVFYVRIEQDGSWRWIDVDARDLPELSNGLAPDTWHHIAGTWDKDHARLYVNGKLVDETPAEGTLRTTSSNKLTVGGDTAYYGLRNAFDGQIDNVRVSNSLRYTEAFRPFRDYEPDPMTALLLQFDGPVGGYLYDRSPSAAHLAIEGDATVVEAEF